MTDDAPPRSLDARREALYQRLLAERGLTDRIAPADRSRPLPASFAQERAWFLDQLEGDLPIQNVTKAFWLRGALDLDALARALDHVVRRHEPLRTVFELVDGVLVQRVQDAGAVGLERRSAEPERVAEIVANEARRAIDLRHGPILRAVHVAAGDLLHALILTVHHIAADGWSAGLLVGELCAAYAAYAEGRAPEASLPDITYVDVAAWQRSAAGATQIENGARHFRSRLANPPPPLDLPASHPAPSPRTGRGGEVPVALGDLEDAVRTFARTQQATLFEVLLTAYAALLSRMTGADDLIIGTPYANRPHRSLESLIGLFATTIPIRVSFEGRPSFEELLRRVRSEVRTAATFQGVPFDRVVQEVRRANAGSPHVPLFNVWFALQNWPMPRLTLPGLQVEPIAVPAEAIEFDLTLDLWRPAEGLGGRLEFSRDLYDELAARSIAGWYRTLIADALEHPRRPVTSLRLLGDHQRREVLALGRGAAAAPCDVLQSLARHAREHPTMPAVIHERRVLDYADLERRSDQLAADLIRAGMGPERIAAVRLPPDWRFAVAIVAALKTGGAFLPIDADTPAPRFEQICDDAQPAVVIRAGVDGELEIEGGRPPLPQVGATAKERLAYVIYTSGSTGRPKGAATPHRCLEAYVAGAIETFGLRATDRILQFAPLAFDVIIEELFPIWAVGGSVVFRGDSLPLEPREFAELVARHGVTIVEIPNLYWHLLADEVDRGLELPPSLRLLLVGCGAMATDRVRAWQRTGVDLIHVYGLSETTVTSTVCDLARWPIDAHRWPRLPIGSPTPESRVYLLDANLEPVPPGVRGEIYLGGDLVGRGYVNAPGTTADRFVPDPFAPRPGARMYRTGDGGRYLGDGTLDFLGRRDEQVKVRGFRVELGEIDAGCRAHSDVLEVATIAVASDGGDHRLVTFVVPRPGSQLDARAVRDHLRQRLPAYMVPAEIVFLARVPETANGKVDRKALQELRRAPSPRSALPPRTATELAIASTWQELLGIDGVGLDDDFFVLGGHSLLATRVAARLGATLGTSIPVKWLFEVPVVRDLATRIEEAGGPATVPIPRRAPGADAALSFMQEHLWFLHRMDPESAAYHLPTAVRLRGALDVAALESALQSLTQRHEILRTVFIERDGVVRQRVLDEPSLQVAIIDLSAHGDGQIEVDRQARAAVQVPFDLEAAPPLRAHLWRLGDDDHVLLLTLHHLLADAWSLGIVVEELTEAYAAAVGGAPHPLAEPPVQFADVATWQRTRLTPERAAQDVAYWKQQLAGRPHGTILRGDYPRPAARTGDGDTLGFAVPDEIAHHVRTLARDCGATPASVVLAAFAHLLHRRTGDSDIIIGVPTAGRDHPDTHRLIGCLLNTVVVRQHVTAVPFVELVQSARGALAGALAHSEVPFERIVEAMHPPRDLSLHPLFQIMFSFEQLMPARSRASAITVERHGVHTGSAQFDLTLDITDDGHAMNGVFCFATDLFATPMIAALRDDLLATLGAAATDRYVVLEPKAGPPARAAQVRGFRVELDELEQALRALPDVHDVHIWVDGEPPTLACLVQTRAPIAEAEFRQHLSERLAAYMTPTHVTLVTSPIRDVEGRVNRAMLQHGERGDAPATCSNDTALALAALWRDVLGLSDVRPDDNFFTVGGDSLACLTLVAKARSRGLSFTPRDVFRHQTLAALAAVVTAVPAPTIAATPRFAAARVSAGELATLLDHVDRIRR